MAEEEEGMGDMDDEQYESLGRPSRGFEVAKGSGSDLGREWGKVKTYVDSRVELIEATLNRQRVWDIARALPRSRTTGCVYLSDAEQLADCLGDIVLNPSQEHGY